MDNTIQSISCSVEIKYKDEEVEYIYIIFIRQRIMFLFLGVEKTSPIARLLRFRSRRRKVNPKFANLMQNYNYFLQNTEFNLYYLTRTIKYVKNLPFFFFSFLLSSMADGFSSNHNKKGEIFFFLQLLENSKNIFCQHKTYHQNITSVLKL